MRFGGVLDMVSGFFFFFHVPEISALRTHENAMVITILDQIFHFFRMSKNVLKNENYGGLSGHNTPNDILTCFK